MFAREDILVWEAEQSTQQIGEKKHKNPRASKTKDYRKGIKSVHFGKECTGARRAYSRLYRTQMKHLMRNEKYELLNGYKHTGGWLTW
ncbi:hypothetical protein AB4Z29_01385 [Paenibacillus sp. 2TAB23]|uniref:hypothetical protein n=1 Tax=Paenibacillus sp. 2TAB23 TaxID=3233004 RepID=UPI003F946519